MGDPHSEESTIKVAFPYRKIDDEGHTHETSHVFQCMLCDLQFQADTVSVSHEESQEEEEQLVHLRLPEAVSQIQRAIAEQMYEHIRGESKPMTTFTQPLREEHKELLPHIERLRTVADSIGTAPIESVQKDIEEAYTFLTHQLIPHAQAEERALYPTVGRLMGAPEATATMSRDHREIDRLSQELGTLRSHLSASPAQEQALRRVLYGLYALVKEHFAKEEEIYLPLLDTRLTAQEALQMFEALEMAAQEAKRSVVR
jgi:iron-sulfur cluster repair protein YtfE (RIC family)